jgi:glycoside/pentoside/hexuronide:cation symporter, GPH family
MLENRPSSLGVTVIYAIGELAVSIRMVLFGLFLLFFYSTVMGLSGTMVGVATGVGFAWNAVVDPLVGLISDRTDLPIGKRHGFMLVGALTMGITSWALFAPPRGLPELSLFAWLLVASLLLRVASSVFAIPYLALGAELTQDYHARSLVAGVRGVSGLIGLIAAASLPFLIFFPNRPGGGDPKLSYDGYPTMGLVFGVAMTVFALVATFCTLQFRSPPVSQLVQRAATIGNILRTFGSSLQNRSFRAILLASALFFLGTVVNAALAIHFLTYYAQITDNRSVSLIQVSFYAAAGIGVPIWLYVARRVEKRHLFLIAAVGTAALLLVARLLVGPSRPFGTGNALPIMAGEAVAGFFASLFFIIPSSMIADIADEDALATGERREGVFFGMFSLGQQIAAGLSALATGVLLDRFAGLVPGQASQSLETAERIGLLATWLPGVMFLLAAVAIRSYSLDHARVRAIQTQLAGRGLASTFGADGNAPQSVATS